MTYAITIPMRLPGLNEYTKANRSNCYQGAKMKKETESAISIYLAPLPRFNKPVTIDFVWVEENKRRDLDNIAFAKKFILDALVKSGKLADDNRRNVTAFRDRFEYAKESKVILYITEVEDGDETVWRNNDL